MVMDMEVDKPGARGEQIIRYSNIIRIVEAEYQYSYSYLSDFFEPNNICMRDSMNDVMMNPMSDRGKRIIRYSNIIRIVEAEY